MKRVFLIRHAKSDWSIQGIDDIDRPLNERGYSDALRISKKLDKTDNVQSIFFSSPAIRAMSTALILARGVDYPVEKIKIYPALYEAHFSVYEDLLCSLDDKLFSVYIFGHNPTISRVIERFSSMDIGDIPTCAVSVLNFEIDNWKEIISTIGKIDLQLFPKMLTE